LICFLHVLDAAHRRSSVPQSRDPVDSGQVHDQQANDGSEWSVLRIPLIPELPHSAHSRPMDKFHQ
jgi:hypothetical protein